MTTDTVKPNQEANEAARKVLGLTAENLPVKKPKRLVWDSDMVKWTLKAFGQAKINGRYDMMLPLDIKNHRLKIVADLKTI